MMSEFLYTIPYSSFDLWDVKRYSKNTYTSRYSIEPLGRHIRSEIEKINLPDFPEETFSILGISNEIGMHDAYDKKGKEFNQPYKIVKDGYIAYNPYRVNVGSIGIKTPALKGNLISPAYVVFSCKETILPEFLFLLMKTNMFNKQVRENTSGSVRQNLTYDALASIKIPVPTLSEQAEILSVYNSKMAEANAMQYEHSYNEIENEIEKYLQLQAYTNIDSNEKLSFINYSDCLTWDVRNKQQRVFISSKYKQQVLSKVAQINPTIRKNILDEEDVSFIPMECVSDLDGKIKEKRTCKASAKGFTKFEEGDIIWAKITPCMQNGKSAIVRGLTNGIGYGSTEFYVIRVNETVVLPEYVYYLLRMYRVRETAVNHFSGSAGQQRVRKSFLEELSIPVPSLEEQEVMVATLNNIKSEIITNRTRVEELICQAKRDFENAIFKE